MSDESMLEAENVLADSIFQSFNNNDDVVSRDEAIAQMVAMVAQHRADLATWRARAEEWRKVNDRMRLDHVNEINRMSVILDWFKDQTHPEADS